MDAGLCSSCRGGQHNLVSSTTLASLLCLALPSLWINVNQPAVLACVCQAALPTPQSAARRKTPRSSTLELSTPRRAWPVSGTEGSHRPPLAGLGTPQGVCWGHLGVGAPTHTCKRWSRVSANITQRACRGTRGPRQGSADPAVGWLVRSAGGQSYTWEKFVTVLVTRNHFWF